MTAGSRFRARVPSEFHTLIPPQSLDVPSGWVYFGHVPEGADPFLSGARWTFVTAIDQMFGDLLAGEWAQRWLDTQRSPDGVNWEDWA